MPRRHEDEADKVRDDVIQDLRARLDKAHRLFALLVGVCVLGALTAILGGPAAVQALSAVQGLVGLGP